MAQKKAAKKAASKGKAAAPAPVSKPSKKVKPAKPRTVEDAVQEQMVHINDDPFAQGEADREQSIEFYEQLATECQEWADQIKREGEDAEEEGNEKDGDEDGDEDEDGDDEEE